MAAASARTSRCWWRIAFVIYAAALTTLTHWPRVELGEPGLPGPDKMLHLYCFAVFTAMLWMTRWLPHAFLLLIAGLAWVAADELTQAALLPQRQGSLQDFLAGASGVIVTAAMVWATAPLGGAPSRLRRSFNARVSERFFGSPLRDRRALLAWTLLPMAFFPIGLSILWAWPRVVAALPNPLPGIIYGVSQALWLGLLLHLFGRLWTPLHSRATEEQWCPHCGSATAGVAPADDAGWRACPACGERAHEAAWIARATPEPGLARRLALRPLIFGVVFLIVEFGAIYGLFALHQWIMQGDGHDTMIRRIARDLANLSRDFTMAIDFSLLLLALAIVIRLFRAQLARMFDAQDAACRRCGHDVRYTRSTGGLGRCGECGTPFARLEA